MPIYEFKCDGCQAEKEIHAPLNESGRLLRCECGRVMRRKFTPVSYLSSETGRDKVLGVLNNDGKRHLPGGHKHSKRYEQAMAKGLEQRTSQQGQFRPISNAMA